MVYYVLELDLYFRPMYCQLQTRCENCAMSYTFSGFFLPFDVMQEIRRKDFSVPKEAKMFSVQWGI